MPRILLGILLQAIEKLVVCGNDRSNDQNSVIRDILTECVIDKSLVGFYGVPQVFGITPSFSEWNWHIFFLSLLYDYYILLVVSR